MRFSFIALTVSIGLLFSATAFAGDGHGPEASEMPPPVEASPPDTPIAAPASPGEAAEEVAEAAEAEASEHSDAHQ